MNHKNTADAVSECFKKENIDVFVRQGVYTKNEAVARAKIQLENYVKTVCVDARTMIDMATRQIYPAVSAYVGTLCDTLAKKKALFSSLPCTADEKTIRTLSVANENMLSAVENLKADLSNMPKNEQEAARRTAHVIVPRMREIRGFADEMEKLCAKEYWPFPDYYDLLFGVK